MADPLQLQPPLAVDAQSLAFDLIMQRITALDPSPVLTCLVDLAAPSVLEHLAVQFHMRHTVAWRRASVDEKRGLLKQSAVIHRRKGTLAGLRWAAQSAGAQLVRAVTPPAKCFASPALTAAERNAFVALYPQLRIYRYRAKGVRIGAMSHKDFAGGAAFPVATDAAVRIAPRSFIYRDGAETPLETIERVEMATDRTARTVTQVKAPGKAGFAAFCAGTGWRYPAVTDAAARIYTVVLAQHYIDTAEALRRVTYSPGLAPIDVHFEAVAQAGHAVGIFAGRPLLGMLLASTAADRLFSRIYLFDPGIAVKARAATLHCAGRLGMPRHHAELGIQIKGRASALALNRFASGFFATQPKIVLDDAIEAMRDCARLSDRIVFDTAIYHPVHSAQTVFAGSYKAGDWTPA